MIVHRLLQGPLAAERGVAAQVRDRFRQLAALHGIVDQPRRTAERESENDREALDAVVELRAPSPSDLLFDYQQELVEQAREAVDEAASALVSLPTGAGKTRIGLALAMLAAESGSASHWLWLAPTRELLDQASTACESLWRRCHRPARLTLVRAYAGGQRPTEGGASITFSTPQMLVARTSRSRRRATYDAIVFDEAHHAIAPTFKRAVTTLRQQDRRRVAFIGLSATPGRARDSDTDSLVELFQGKLLVSATLRPNALAVLRARGVLADIEFVTIPLPRRAVGHRNTISGASELTNAAALQWNAGRFEAVVQLLTGALAREQALVFCGSRAHACALAAVLEDKGESASVISSALPVRDRARLLNAFRNGDVRLLLNKSLLATGFDYPGLANAVLTMPIGSSILFEQIVGRICRGPQTGGVTRATVWQLDDHLAIHDRPSSYHRFEDFDWSSLQSR